MKAFDEVRFSLEAKDYLEQLAISEIDKIKSGIDIIKIIPSKGDRRPIIGYKEGRMRLRIENYRVIYRYDNDEKFVLYIIDIDSRDIL